MMKKLIYVYIILFSSTQIFSQKINDYGMVTTCSYNNYFQNNYKFQSTEQSDLVHCYDVKFYFLDINVENNTTYISGNVTINAIVQVEVMDTFAFELADELTIDSVVFNGNSLSFTRSEDNVFVPVLQLVQGDFISANIYYYGLPPPPNEFSGVFTESSTVWEKNVTWTVSEPFNAKLWWPCKQVLSDKADSVYVFLTTSANNKAGSQGLLTAITPMQDNKVRYEWKSFYPIDYYLISFSVSEYQDYTIYAKPEDLNGDSILIQNYIYDTPGCLENYKTGIDRTIEFLELFSDLYGTYPFYKEKYGHCLTEMGGGMEHQTMTTIGGFGFGIVAHELGHMWFGDNVTCATWSDIWINEGFATYSDYLAHEFIAGGEWPKIWMEQAHNNVLSQPGGSIYIPPELISPENFMRIFDGRLSYAKGACIVHMIRFELQDNDLFFQVLKDFQEQFCDSIATGLDFKSVLENTTGMDFTYFFDQWYFGEGYPIYDIVWNQTDSMFDLTSYQTTSTAITPLFKMLMEYKLYFNDGTDTSIFLNQTINVNNYIIPIEKAIDSIAVDPENWVLNKVNSITHSIEEIDNPVYFILAPNPCTDQINICFTKIKKIKRHITIFDISGKIVLEKDFRAKNINLNTSSFKKGIYVIKITDGKNVMIKKFVKN